MSLILAAKYADAVGLTHVLVTPDPQDRQYIAVDADKPITPGVAATLRNRLWLAVHDHRRACSEPVAVLEDPWELVRTPTGAWVLRHEHCAMRSAA